ncbi:MAG: transcriptional regulator [Limnobacter sp.]|nr:transcriptional regulator [Limnobacter sp.]
MQTQSRQMSGPAAPEMRWIFGDFVVSETQRRVERSGQAIRLGPRTFELLLQLIRRAGEYVSKDELLASVWAGVVVADGSVRVHMSMLRKALGEPDALDECREWISNVPLRGYRFNGRVRRDETSSSIPVGAQEPAPSFTKPPLQLCPLVGREAEVSAVCEALDSHRMVTVIGTGGIGKTSVAIRAAECYRIEHGISPAFVDLSPLISSEHVKGTIARALGAAADMPDLVQAVAQSLAGREVLLLLDNCEHVIDSLVVPITRLLGALPGVRVLATSREPLRMAGEHAVRLPALATPEADCTTLAQALAWPAVRLLVDRAESTGACAFGESDAPRLARIARQLDGIPLAIELVAARLGAQSINDLALRLNDHMRLHSASRRSLVDRHRTLAAALEWSVSRLDDDELRLFRRLSVFRGRFDLDCALSVNLDLDAESACDALISLANKSLVSFDGSDAVAPYRLLDTTRSFAAGMLARSDERPMMLRRHAKFMLDLMNAATAELPKLTEQAWAERYAHRLDDVRFALEVSRTGPEADVKTAASLVIASGPLWFHVSQVDEYRGIVADTLALVEQQSEPDTESATWLSTALIIALLHTGGPNEELDAACDRALAGALAIASKPLELRARWGRCTHEMFRGNYANALMHSDALFEFAQSWSDAEALVLARRVSAMANHFYGAFETSRRHSAAAIALSGTMGRKPLNLVGPDPLVATQALLCRTLWLQGQTGQALQVAGDAVARALSIEHSVSLCAALYGACPVALWAGERELARTWIPMMRDEAQRRGLRGWLRYAEWFLLGLQLELAEDRGLCIREQAGRLGAYDTVGKEMFVTFCADWLDDDLIARVDRGEGRWCAAEVRRATGWRDERRGRFEQAEASYLQAIETARQQGAIAWELRAALSLARLWAARGRPLQAAHLLDESCARVAPDSGSRMLVELRSLRERCARR